VKYFRREVVGKELTLYPLVCMHVGAPQADEDFIREHVARIKDDPTGAWVYLGDGGECVTKSSKGELYTQRLSPDEQIDRIVELLEPVSGRGLFGIAGNHDRRIAKLSGLDWTNALCVRLGIPYLGNAAFARFVFTPKANSAMRVGFETFWHHGIDSSSLLGGKANAARKLEQLVWADALFSAHSHVCLDMPPSYVAYLPQNADEIKYREVRNFVCGCAYDSRVPGYAEEKGYAPILPAWLSVRLALHGNHNSVFEREMTCRVWRKPC